MTNDVRARDIVAVDITLPHTVAVGLTLDGGGPLAVVEDGQFAKNFSGRQDAQEFAFARHLDFAL
jgi:hypothetical protein